MNEVGDDSWFLAGWQAGGMWFATIIIRMTWLGGRTSLLGQMSTRRTNVPSSKYLLFKSPCCFKAVCILHVLNSFFPKNKSINK